MFRLYKILILNIIFILLPNLSYSQNIDSLKTVLNSELDVIKRIEILEELANISLGKSPKQSVEFSKEILILANKNNLPNNKAIAYYILGKSYYYITEYDSAIISLKKSLQIYQQLDNKKKIGELYDKIGSCYYSGIANYTEAMKYYFKSLELSEQENDTIRIAYSLNNLGNIYFRLNKRDKALASYMKALEYASKTMDKKINGILLNNIGAEYANKKKYTKALEYNFKAVDIKKEMGGGVGLAATYISIGSLYKYQNNFEDALKYYNDAKKILETNINSYYSALVMNYMSAVYQEKKEYQTAIKYLNISLTLSEEISANTLSKNSYLALTKIYKELHNFEKAFFYNEKYSSLHDTIFSQESNKALNEMQVKYESAKKEKENETLKHENDLNELKIEKQKSRALILTIISILLFVLIILTVVLAIFIYNKYRYKQEINGILNDKNNQLELTNKKLAESENNLRELVATKDKFFSIIAHDLRSPLSSLSLVTEVLDQNLNDLDKQKTIYLISSINNAANNLLELVENLLHWARTQTGKITFEPNKINLTNIIKQNISLLGLNAEKKNITIKNNIEKSIFAFADINLITTVIRNLLTNAVKFTDENGIISFSMAETDNYYEIKITDNGLGISNDNLKQLFRIDIDTKQIGNSTEKGTGLGLILCKEFIEKNGGKINVKSELGIGSTFSFTVLKAN